MVPEFHVVPILWNFLTVGVKRHKNHSSKDLAPSSRRNHQKVPPACSESRSPAGGLEAIDSSCDVHTRDRASEGDGLGEGTKKIKG